MTEDRQTIHTVRQLLDESAKRISPDIQARLNFMVAQAVELRQVQQAAQKAQPLLQKRKAAQLQALTNRLSSRLVQWLNRPVLSLAISTVFVVAAMVGVVQTAQESYDARVTELATLDAEILSDDLPPSAYLDTGFAGFANQRVSQELQQTDQQINEWMDSIPDPAADSLIEPLTQADNNSAS